MKEDKKEKTAKSDAENAKTEQKSAKTEDFVQNEKVKDFAVYEKALKELEESLSKVYAELEISKKVASENENLARVYKKDLERFKERNRNAEQEMKDRAAIATAEKLIPVLCHWHYPTSWMLLNLVTTSLSSHTDLVLEVMDSQ